MEDQGKRLFLAVGLALGVMLLWQFFSPAEEKKPPASPTKSEEKKPAVGSPVGRAGETTPAAPAPAAEAPAVVPGAAAPGGDAAAPAAPAVPAPVVVAAGADEEIVLEHGDVRAVFTNAGGGLKSWRLLDKKHENEPSKGEMVEQSASAPIVSMLVNFVGSSMSIQPRAAWQGKKVSDREVEYRFVSDRVEVTKRFTFYPESYLLRLSVETVAKSEADAKAQLAVSVFGFQDPNIEIKSGMGRQPRDWKGACDVGDEIHETEAAKLKDKGKDYTGAVHWGGFMHPFQLIAVAPKSAGPGALSCYLNPVAGSPGHMQADVVWPVSAAKAGEVSKHEVVAYMGPKLYDRLKASSEIAGFPTGFEKSVDLGFFSPIAKPLLWLLLQFYALAGNWGIAIIMLTILVKLATLYWTTKSMRSMRAMADLKPKLDELQKKYGDDRQRLQTEMMALYKEHGVNPLAGCLPMLLQMPIWLALYRMLSAVGELYLAPFIPGWISDLTATDPYHILPVVLLVAMFAQAKLSPTAVDSTQQKMLVYGMPILFGVMGFFFPSGLSLYILTNTVLSAVHTLYMLKTGKKPVPVAVATANDKATDKADAPASPAASEPAGDKPGKGGNRGGAGKGGKGRKR